MSEPTFELFLGGTTMDIYDKYRLIRSMTTKEAAAEIEAAINKVKGKSKLSVKDFLPK